MRYVENSPCVVVYMPYALSVRPTGFRFQYHCVTRTRQKKKGKKRDRPAQLKTPTSRANLTQPYTLKAIKAVYILRSSRRLIHYTKEQQHGEAFSPPNHHVFPPRLKSKGLPSPTRGKHSRRVLWQSRTINDHRSNYGCCTCCGVWRSPRSRIYSTTFPACWKGPRYIVNEMSTQKPAPARRGLERATWPLGSHHARTLRHRITCTTTTTTTTMPSQRDTRSRITTCSPKLPKKSSGELVRASHLQHGCNGALFGRPSAASTEPRAATDCREVLVSQCSGSPGHVLHCAEQKYDPPPPPRPPINITHHTQDGGGRYSHAGCTGCPTFRYS